MKVLIQLFMTFFKIGAFSFGGGYAMLPLLEEEVIRNHAWMTSGEFINIFAISEMTPGPIAVNAATFVGFRVSGILGAAISTFAVILPSFIVISLIFASLAKFKKSKYVAWIFEGIRPIVIGLIMAAGVTVAKSGFSDVKSIIIALSLFYTVSFKDLNPIFAIIIGGILGVVLY